MCVLVAGLLLGVTPRGARAQTDVLVVDGTQVGILPSAAGMGTFDLHVVASFDVEGSAAPFDASMDMIVLVNGTCVAPATRFELNIDSHTAGACGAGPPCSGSCGSYTLNGDDGLPLLCYKDGECTPTFCDCDCGAWLSAVIPDVSLVVGDEITIILYPAPAATDPDFHHITRMTFDGGVTAWNRGLETLTATPGPAGGMDVEVSGYVEYGGDPEAFPDFLNLDLEVELRINGTPHATQIIQIGGTVASGNPCATGGCGTACGIVGGAPKTCQDFPGTLLGCACGTDWLTTFNAVPAAAGDEIIVLLRPAPGAIPEVFPGDDALSPVVLAVGEAGGGPTLLRQNAPNPFRPATMISFRTGRPGDVRIEVFDLAGRQVRTLVRKPYPAGEWSVTWDGTSDEGERLPAGSYLYRLTVDGERESRKLILLQ
jgi:hypothetical protein